METITVIPRVEGRERTPILFLPDDPANPGRIGCYAHVGQHSEAALDYYQRHTKPAKPGECDALLREYAGIPPTTAILRIRKRRPS